MVPGGLIVTRTAHGDRLTAGHRLPETTRFGHTGRVSHPRGSGADDAMGQRGRAMVIDAPGPGPAPLRDRVRPWPAPDPGQVLIRVAACAVCRTDLQLASGDLPAHRLPVVPGHQIVGEVVGHGEEVDPAVLGSRVGVAWIAGACGECRFCRSGRENLCRAAIFTGWDVDGGYADYVTARVDFAYPLPPEAGSSDVHVAPLLCGGAIGLRCLRIAGVGPADRGLRLGLYGFGASATVVLQIAKYFGFETYVVTRSAGEAQRALDRGATWAGTYQDRLPTILDAAITFAPAGAVVYDALKAVDRGAPVVINAIHLDELPSMDYDRLWHERSLRSVANVTRRDVVELLDLIGPAGITTDIEVLPLTQANEALRRLAAGEVRGAAVLVTENPSDSG